jgi:hypothetical protein
VPPLFAFVFVAAQAWTDRVESHFTTDSQSASPPLKKVPIWGPQPDLHHYQRITCMLLRLPHGCEDGSAAYNRCRPSPAQALSGRSLARPATTHHRHRFETSLFVTFHDSLGTGGGTGIWLHMKLVISIILKSYRPCMWRYYLCITFRVWLKWEYQTFELVVICIIHWSKPIYQM